MAGDDTKISGIASVRRLANAVLEGTGLLRPRTPEPGAPSVEARRQKLADAISAAEGIATGKLVIERDDASKRFVYKIVDPQSGETIRQYPREQWLELSRRIGTATGLLVDSRL